MIGHTLVIPVTPHMVRAMTWLVDSLTPRLDPADLLCDHHAGTLRAWRREHPHEDAGDYQRRCADIARQCCQARP